ncbi:hypothetical protein DFP74_6203 [Nocardiopsis sp. Huas11]|nr:hypothetical protein DFP74_6203 [Nocardiopsis sp. Huas11]
MPGVSPGRKGGVPSHPGGVFRARAFRAPEGRAVERVGAAASGGCAKGIGLPGPWGPEVGRSARGGRGGRAEHVTGKGCAAGVR